MAWPTRSFYAFLDYYQVRYCAPSLPTVPIIASTMYVMGGSTFPTMPFTALPQEYYGDTPPLLYLLKLSPQERNGDPPL